MATTTYSFTITDYLAPFLRNRDPDAGEAGVEGSSNIEFDLLDDASGVNTATIDAYVEGALVFSGPSTFIAPFDGPSSAITATIVDGYAGFHMVLDRTSKLPGSTLTDVRVSARDLFSNHLDETYTFRTAAGIDLATVGPFEINVNLRFSEDMTGELDNPANYSFGGGAYARLVEVFSQRDVRLWVEQFQGNDPFTIITNSNILDSYSAPLPASAAIELTPFQSGANMSNTNGRVRTWRESVAVAQDEERIILAGTKGIDVFDKRISVSPPARWGQIFDDYGIDALFYANFGGDFLFSDNEPPFFAARSPGPSSTALPTTNITFTIEDEDTAVEITATAVYVNALLAFSGSEGFVNGFSGEITVGYQQLNFTITPPAPFTPGTTISVRAMATDLLGNTLNQTYSFSIVSPTPGGFGTGPFGVGSFGT